MDILINAFRRNFKKSNFLLELCQHVSGKKYVRIEQFKKTTNSLGEVLISEDDLSDIIDQLKEFEFAINLDKKAPFNEIISIEDERLIVSFFLKGVKIKDLSLTYRYSEQLITDILVRNDISIIDGIDMPNSKKYFKFPKRNLKRRK